MISDVFKGWSIKKRYQRRRLVVIHWACFAMCIVLFWLTILRHNHALDTSYLIFLLMFPAMLGGVRAGGAVKPFRGVHWPMRADRYEMITLFHRSQSEIVQDSALDERDIRLRDRVHFVAYTVTRWLALASFLIYYLLYTQWPAFAPVAGSTFLYLLAWILWILPQSIILWNEPDVETDL